MKILYLTQVLPYPLDAGPKLRAYYVLHHLAQRHRVTLLSFTRPSDTPEALSHLESFCDRVVTVPMIRTSVRDALAFVKSLLIREPLLITRDHVPDMFEQIDMLVKGSDFDVIHADQLWMANYALSVKPKLDSIRYVLDQHNAVHLIPQRMAETETNAITRWLLTREAHMMARYEARVCQQFDHVIWVTRYDYTALRSKISKDGRLRAQSNAKPKSLTSQIPTTTSHHVIPICIDPYEVTPIKPLTQSCYLLFVGGMHWPPNAQGIRWFLTKVWPQVRKQLPQAGCIIVGKSPPSIVRGKQGVLATGYMEKIDKYWSKSRAFIVPLHAGGGMRVKILEAWARGLPVVSTSIGGEGIRMTPGKDILIADTPEQFADAVVNLLCDDQLAEYLAKAGRKAVERYYDWRQVYPCWDNIYSEKKYLDRS